MKRIMRVFLLIASAGCVPFVEAALLVPGSTGTIQVTDGCFRFGRCAIDERNIVDNERRVAGIGSSIGGDGLVGVMNFVVGSDGNSFTLTSFNMDTIYPTGLGDLATRMQDPSSAGGRISDSGEMILTPVGRTGILLFFVSSLGERPFMIDTHGSAQTYCAPGSGRYFSLTTGLSVAHDCWTGDKLNELIGTPLSGSVIEGQYRATGTLVSNGALGSDWEAFDGVLYSEIYDITVFGTAIVPVPAAVWLMGSGLVSVFGFARRRDGSCKTFSL